MASTLVQGKAIGSSNAATLLDEMKLIGEAHCKPATRKVINSELWHACAGPLVGLPQPGSLVYYYPQGHSEQVTASTKKTANFHIPNYPNLPSQLMCQVHNVTLHADKETDEIYAQMTLQPVNSEMDVYPIPDFGHTKSKQPTEFFCKNLTASDTSTHGGFSVPRRAAEKLFPQLDYSMQPPNQELIVRDLHDSLWTFKHIYRGQPKRHLLTTGWSLFVSAKRLKAGDSVLFIRDEKSQLLLGVRRAYRQQTTLPSSVLSSDSMHLGVLAAAAHATASLSPFTVYYNPRACPSEFIVPLSKYHKAAYTQVSVGMRFGMMFETEESTKRRYMGTIVGVSDYDPLRWPNSKWRNLQVEWDEHGYGERPERVSLWEIETPESLFNFPSQNPAIKRQCLPGFVVSGTGTVFGNSKPPQALEDGTSILHPVMSGLGPEQIMKMLLKPQNPIPEVGFHQSIYASILQNIRNSEITGSSSSTLPTFQGTRSPIQHETANSKMMMQQRQQFPPLQHQQVLPMQNMVLPNQKALHEQFKSLQEQDLRVQDAAIEHKINPLERCESVVENSEPVRPPDHDILVAQLAADQGPRLNHQDEPELDHGLLEPASSQYLNHDIWMPHASSYQPFATSAKANSVNLSTPERTASSSADISSIVNPEAFSATETLQFSSIADSHSPSCLPNFLQEIFGGQELIPLHDLLVSPGILPFEMHDLPVQEEGTVFQEGESNNQSETYSDMHFGAFSTGKTSGFHVPCDGLVGNFTSNQDIQSQVTSASLAESSQPFCLQDIPDSSGGTSSGSVDISEYGLFTRCPSNQAPQQPLRTYTKVQKQGSVGRSIDVTRFTNYCELTSAVACMFGLEGQLDDPRSSEWKLVYVDYENDVLLVGDDPWEEFVNCVRCIRILSPPEIQQMSQEGLPPC